MIHQFYKYEVDLKNYQMRDFSKSIVEYDKAFERSLITTIRKFQDELHWDGMWTVSEVYSRLSNGYHFFVWRPYTQIKGWVWLAPDGELKNGYVTKWSRRKGWLKQLCIAGMNKAWELEYPKIYARIDIWNRPSIWSFEKLIGQLGCSVNCKLVEEEYE